MRIVLLSLGSAGSCSGVRVPVLACRDALRQGGAEVDVVTAESDQELDAAVESTLPGSNGVESEPNGAESGLVVAATSDGELRAVLRRMVRRYAPPPSKRPAGLPADRTIPDLPPIGVLPLDSSRPPELVTRLQLPRTPEQTAAAVLGGNVRRFDLFRTDSGSVTLHGALIGGSGEQGQAAAWQGKIEVDDTVLSDGAEPLLACAIANSSGHAVIDDLPLVGETDPTDGLIDVGVVVPVVRQGLLRRKVRVEVRRSRGRAVSITPRDPVAYLDDGVAGTLGRKRSWWAERTAWAVYVPTAP